MEYIGVHLIDLPVSVGGFSMPNDDSSYSIFINARWSVEMQKAVYDHEMAHINNNDFDSAHPVDEIEALRHNIF